MRNNDEEHVHSEYFEGFTIDFYAAHEYDSPRDHFSHSGEDDPEADIVEKIENGAYAWFAAHVTASKAGIVLAEDWLGCCCYDSAADFVKANDYYDDMRSEVVRVAREKIKELNDGVLF